MDAQKTADRVVAALGAEGLLAPGADERARAVVAGRLTIGGPTSGAGMSRLVEVVAYLGGALVLAAGFLFVMQSWDDLGDVGQVSFLAAVTLALGVAGGRQSRAAQAVQARSGAA